MKWKILKHLAFAILITGIAGVIATIGILKKYSKELPDVAELVENYTPPEPTVIYDRNGKIIDVISREKRIVSTLDEIPKSVQEAFMAIEDKRFYEHYGIDPIRITGAMVANLKAGRATQGGSTLTQQLARNAFLSHERKLSRKIKELIITFEIEKKYTKDEIMEKYLNEIYFGSGSYGVKTAADNFFRKDISKINLAEAALLAGVPNSPNYYNPRRNLKNALYRQNLILKQMLRYGFITQEEFDKALEHKFVNEQNAKPEDYNNENVTVIYSSYDRKIEFNAPDFTDLVEDFLVKNFDENEIYNSGLKVYTTLDLDIQKTAKKVFDEYPRLKEDEKLQGSMVTLDVKNGEVISIIGGKDYKTANFNRAVQAKRQFGSSFKPFVYYTALEKGAEANLVIEDSRIVFGSWAPRNYGEIYYNGITMMQGFDKSQNIVSIKLLQDVGLNALINNVQKINKDFYVPKDLTAALGTTEGSPLQLAQAYAVFANGGYIVEPTLIKKITDKFDNTLYTSTPKITPTFDSLNIALMTNMLKNSVKGGTSRNARVTYKKNPIEQGGKTGTTNNSRTVWYAGFTPEYVTTIYLGYDDNSPLTKATGGGTVAPIWKKFYQEIIDKGYYVPGKFEFVENHVKNGDLFYQHLDPATGMIKDSKQNKDFLLRRGKMSVERAEKYANGIAGLLGYETPEGVKEIKTPNENSNSNIIENSNVEITNSDRLDTEIPIIKQPEKKKSLFEKLFGI